MRITIDGKRASMGISRTIDPNKWNQRKGRAIGNHKESAEINSHIDKLTYNVRKIHQELMDRNELVTSKKILNILNGKGEKARLLLDVFREHNQEADKLIGISMSKSTVKRYWTSYEHTKQFINEIYKEDDFPLQDINYDFIKKFEVFLKTVRNCNHNSTLKYINNFKKIIRLALTNEWMTRDPFYNYKVKFLEVKRDFLTEEKIDLLWEKELHFDRLKLVRDMFIFSCYTGLAYSDVEKLTKNDVSIGIDGSKWVCINRIKTNTKSSIPLLPIAAEIIERYAGHPSVKNTGKLIPVLSNQKSNLFLKEIAISCGINKILTTHLARHTFATTVTLTNGGSS
ncbi:site-specific integrase [Dokdonia donghaensis]|uniref:site-specific integrase n=1 Tax=Dokdonia donghaensis TaxID=326320 RepID=UPI0007C5B08E|nr:site-specific integrase [Dokdonia donghaensis]ANH60386.1 site-specific tyrosine recombinase XerD [Dokdonia donghaensis DSW-1]